MAIDKTLYSENDAKVDEVMTQLNQAKLSLDQTLALWEEKKALYPEAFSCIKQEAYEGKLVDMLEELIPELNTLYMGTGIAPVRLTGNLFDQYKNLKSGMAYVEKCPDLYRYAEATCKLLKPIGRLFKSVELLRKLETLVCEKQARVDDLSAEFDQVIKEVYYIDM